MEKTSSRVAMALICGLAICCAVMYVTADGAETVLAPAESVYGIGGPTSVDSEDVEKAGMVVTNTPDGRMRLTSYLSNVESEIAAEEAARKRDVAAVEAQMARNFAFNKVAREKLQAALLAKMAVNAKKAKDDLATSMRFVQAKFAAAAKLQNERKGANIARNKKLRQKIAQNKKIAADDLAAATKTQQRAMAALASMTNERIASTNEHVAINAAQISANAKKAKEELDDAVAQFDQKAAAARKGAAAGRSKLSDQLAEQDKSIRAWANDKLKIVAAKTAAQFRRVREKMAEDRQNADIALKAASTRMTASMDAFTALNDDNFAKNVADIAKAKEEAEARVKAAETTFKTSLYVLTATVEEQVKKTNARVDQLSDTVDKNKVAQAKVNSNVAAEQKRMITLGNERYAEHLKKDKELQTLIESNKAETDKRLQGMAAHYTEELNSVRAEMTKNRAHATHMLAKKSSELYSAIAESEKKQMDVNGELQEQTREAVLNIADSLRDAKDDFAERLGSLHKTVVANDKKFEGKIFKLTGIVEAEAVKSSEGRKELSSIMEANKVELKAAVRDAIHKGETRMQQAEDKLVALNKKTKAALNLKITTEIATLAKRANDQIEGLRLSSKESRDMMKKELLFAVRAMAKEAKKNLDAAVKVSTAKFEAVNAAEAEAYKKSAGERADIAESITIEKENAKQYLADSVATMQRSLFALKSETAEKIKKTNTRVDAYAARLEKESKDVTELMKQQMSTLSGNIEAQKSEASSDIAAADAESMKGFKKVMTTVSDELAAASEASDAKFGVFYTDMATQRADLDKDLAASVSDINDKIAKQAALQDTRFSKTVKDLAAAKQEAADEVRQARSDFATGLATVTSNIKDMESRLTGEVQVIAAEVISHKAAQHRVNVHTTAEIKRIEDLMNSQRTSNSKARGVIREIMNQNKKAAHEEVTALDNLFKGKIAQIRSEAAADAQAAKKDLTEKTMTMYSKMADAQRDQQARNEDSATRISEYSATSLKAIADARADFTGRLDVLTNTVAANHGKVEKGFEILTGVIRDFKEQGEADRALIVKQNAALAADMQKAIVVAIQEGEAKAKAVADRSRARLVAEQKSMLVEITNTVEDYADMAFKTIQGNHPKIADNYLSLKAYAATAVDAIEGYIAEGKGKNLSSLGDLLTSIGSLADVTAEPAEGILPSGFAPNVFTGSKIKIDNSVSKVNGLVKEYFLTLSGCRERWPMGLGKYLLEKLEDSMTAKGVLQVDKIDEKSGNWVFVNGHMVGLSNKLNDFEGLAVRMGHYEQTLAKLTAGLSGKVAQPTDPVYVPAPEWQGN